MSLESMKKMPMAAQQMFEATHKKAKSKGHSDVKAGKIAWSVVKKRFTQKDGKWVARTSDFIDVQYYTFTATPAEHFIERTEGGALVHNYILTDLFPDKMGTAPTEAMLNKWASWLNEHKPEVDTDHEMFQAMKEQYGGNVKLVERAMRFKKGIAKTLKAFVDKGKLVVSLVFDKRYEKFAERVKGLSVEAAVKVDNNTRKWKDGQLFGYTLAMNQNPINPRSRKV